MTRFWLYYLIGGFAAGVLVRSFYDLGAAFAAFLLVLGVAIALPAALTKISSMHVSAKESGTALLVALVLFGGGLGVLRYDVADHPALLSQLEERVGRQATIEGIVVDEPDVRENSTRLRVEVRSIENPGITTRVLVVTGLHPQFSYGDRILASGELGHPRGFETDTGRYFDYPAYLSKDGVYYQLSFADAEMLSSGHGNPLRRWLFSLKHAFLERLGRVLPEPHSSLAGGLIVGAKESLGEDLLDRFRATGIIHIVVLSGYNITIVADAVTRFFSFLPAVAGMSLGAVSIVAFALLTGASATIVRASIMALLVSLARATGRTYQITYALFLAAFAMVLHNPKILVFDPSFQLSFLATLGLIQLSPRLERWFSLVPTKWKLREVAIATVSTQLFVLPLLIYMTGETSLVALPVNLLVLLTVPAAMLFGFLAGVVGFVSVALAMPVAFVAYALLSYQLAIVELFSSIPFAEIALGFVPFALVVLVYACFVGMLWYFRKGTDTARV